MMKRLSMFVALACLGLALPMYAQDADNEDVQESTIPEYVTYEGTAYKVVSESNLVTNPTFETTAVGTEGAYTIDDWYGGDGNLLSSSNFEVSEEADETTGGKYIKALGTGGSTSENSIVTLWTVDPSKTYYFSIWIRNCNYDFSTSTGNESFLINNNNSSSIANDGDTHVEQHIIYFQNDGDEWAQVTLVFTPSDYATGDYEDANYTYAGLRLAWLEGASTSFEISNVQLYEVEEVTPENPLDITSYILKNADCSVTDTDSDDFGWTNVNFGIQTGASNTTITNEDTGASLTLPYFERWTGSGSSGHLTDGSLSQTISLPAGEYRLQADAIVTQQTDGELGNVGGVYLFAGDEQTSVYTGGTTPETFSVDFAVETAGDVTVGFKNESTDASWVAVDNFKLYYLGDEYDYDVFELGALITEATTLSETTDATGVDDLQAAITAAKAVLDDEDSDAEALAEAISSLKNAIAVFKFENGLGDIVGLWEGWTGIYNSMICEHFDESDKDIETQGTTPVGTVMTQTITGLPEGIYEVELYCVSNFANHGTNDPAGGTQNSTEAVTVAANGVEQAITFGTESGSTAYESLDAVPTTTLTKVVVKEDGILELSVSVTEAGCVNWILAGTKSVTYVGVYYDDDEYAEGDTYKQGTATYNVLSDNLVVNGGFSLGVDGWMNATSSNNVTTYTGDADISHYDYSSTGGYNGGSYITINSSDGGITSDYSIVQPVEVTEGSTYLFIAYTSGKTPAQQNLQYCGVYSMTDATTEGSLISDMQLEWGADAGQTATTGTWTKTETIFTAPSDYVGVRIAWAGGASIDAFQIYEVERTYTLEELEEAIEEAEAATANVGEDAFQIPEDNTYAAAVASALADAQELDESEDATSEAIKAAIDALDEAVEEFADGVATYELNKPADGQVFHIIMAEEGFTYEGKAVRFRENSSYSEAGGYGFYYEEDPNPNFGDQVFTFTSATSDAVTLNGYTISFDDEDGTTHYLCLGETYTGGTTQQIRATEDDTKAYVFQVQATTTENLWEIYNSRASLPVGSSGDSGFYTSNSHHGLSLVDASVIEGTLQAEYGTLVLPFVPTEDEIGDLTFYSTSAYEEDSETGAKLDLVEVEELAANTPYIVGGEEGTEYSFTVTARVFPDEEGNYPTPTDGWLTGVYENITPEDGTYVLQDGVDGLAFYLVGGAADEEEEESGDGTEQIADEEEEETEEATPLTLTMNHCYLTVSETDADDTTDAPAVILLFPGSDGSATAITAVEANVADAQAIYDLSGRKVSNATKGIYIKGGKKVVIK